MASDRIVAVHRGTGVSADLRRILDKLSFETKIVSSDELSHVMSVMLASCLVVEVSEDWPVSIEEFVSRLKEMDDNIPVIVVSDSEDVSRAVEFMKAGVYDYFTYPVSLDKFEHVIKRAIKTYELTKRVFLLESQVGWQGKFDDMVGHSACMQEIFQLISGVAKSNATVLIMGESGTGKELVAKAIHRHSKRARHKFVDINCGAIPRELLENEMFGHEKGAFTGADRRYIGSCERADGGTLFLDEISEMDAMLQVKLLRFIQERSFTRIGGAERIKVDVRIIAATNRDLAEEVAKGNFREDLYYRLDVVPIVIPPLRERREDIPLLAKHFLERYSAKNEKIFLDIAPDAMEAMVNYDWPGNVRELENIVERMVVLYNDSQIKLKHLPENIRQSCSKVSSVKKETVLQCFDPQQVIPLELVEKYTIEAALKRCMGNVSEAAKRLKIGQATLYRKIKQYGLKRY